MAELMQNGKEMKILFNSPCHSIIIGSTGGKSGKPKAMGQRRGGPPGMF